MISEEARNNTDGTVRPMNQDVDSVDEIVSDSEEPCHSKSVEKKLLVPIFDEYCSNRNDRNTEKLELKPQKQSRFEVTRVESIENVERERNYNHFLFSDYFEDTEIDEDEALNPYDLLVRLQFPLKNDRNKARLEKFKNYWENDSFYAIWRKKFIADHSIDEKDVWKEVCLAAIPHLIINVFLMMYVVGGALIFQLIDDDIAARDLHHVIHFTFTTIATVGYGNIVPTTDFSKIFCMFYTLIGVPLLFLSLTNTGQFIAEGYWIFRASIHQLQDFDAVDDRRLPLPIVIFLLLTHSLIGCVLFHVWIDQMDLIPAFYFSFVSITTIGFGDITSTPSGILETAVLISYLAIGMVIMSTFVSALYNYLRRLHYLGRSFKGAAHVEVWFGGTQMSVAELLHIVATRIGVSPKTLYDVLHDLDDLITTATSTRTGRGIEVKQRISTEREKLAAAKHRKENHFETIKINNTNNPEETHILVKGESDLSIDKLSDEKRETVIKALGMMHYLTKTKTLHPRRRSVGY